MHTLRAALAAAVVFCAGPAAYAAPLAPGGVVFPTGTTAAARPELAGTVVNDDLIPFSFPFGQLQSVGGDVQNRVVRSDGLATLIFSPQIRDTFNIAVEEFEIIGFSVSGYGGFSADVDFRTDAPGDDGPTAVSRSVDGDLLTFRYDDPLTIDGIAPGAQEESLLPVILTDAQAFQLTGRMTIFGRDLADPETVLTTEIGGLAVPAAIPLPTSLGLLAAALAGLGLLGRRR